MSPIRPLLPLLITAGILLAGNGVQGTLIAVRGSLEGFTPSHIGAIGALYFAGFMVGCIFMNRLLHAVGHIRTFCAMAALVASSTLLLVVIVDPYAWMALRFIVGFCFAVLFSTVESWINASVANEVRGKVTSIYRIIDLVVVTGAQYMLPLFGAGGFTIFAVMTILIMFSLVPVSLADRSNPKPPEQPKFSPGTVWRISPIACISCVAIGLTSAAFRLIGPIYAEAIGLSVASIATFMSAGIVGGAVLQYPLGYFSDRVDRRYILILASVGAAASGMFITTLAGNDPVMNYLGIFFFGAFALPLYSLAAAHANDFATGDEFFQVAGGLLFFWSAGAILGPLTASILMQAFGPSVLFTFTSAVHVALILATFWRMAKRRAVPLEDRSRFAMLLRTSPIMMKLTRRRKRD